MREYLKHQKNVSEKRKKGWKLAVLAKDIERTFKKGHKEAIFTLTLPSGESIKLTYTPVTPELRSIVEKFGNYLHALKESEMEKDNFWEDFKILIERGLELLDYSVKGSLLGVPLKDKNNRVAIFAIISEEERELAERFLAEERITMHVDYRELS